MATDRSRELLFKNKGKDSEVYCSTTLDKWLVLRRVANLGLSGTILKHSCYGQVFLLRNLLYQSSCFSYFTYITQDRVMSLTKEALT